MKTLIFECEEKFISLEPHVITIITWGMITINLVINRDFVQKVPNAQNPHSNTYYAEMF